MISGRRAQMCRHVVFVIFSLLVLSGTADAQKNKKIKTKEGGEKKQKIFITAGPEINLILPTDFGSDNKGFYGDTMGLFTPSVSFRVGMNVRFDFSKRFSLQTGLYYMQRIYNTEIGIANVGKDGLSTRFAAQRLTYTGFELPVMALIYVQLGDKWFMNNLVGFSADFFPSSVVDTAQGFKIFGGRNSWIIPSLKAAVGFEFRTEKAGYFYMGGQFHRPLVPIFDGFIQRQTPTGSSLWGDNSISAEVSGTYFAIDFKYFFPPGKENKFIRRRKR